MSASAGDPKKDTKPTDSAYYGWSSQINDSKKVRTAACRRGAMVVPLLLSFDGPLVTGVGTFGSSEDAASDRSRNRLPCRRCSPQPRLRVELCWNVVCW